MYSDHSYDVIEKRAAEAGLSVRELYALASVALSTRSRWKTGKTDPNTKTLRKLESVVANKKPKKRGKP